MSRKPCLYDQVVLDDGSEGIIKFIGSLSGKDDLYYGVDLNVLGKHKFNNNNGTIRNIQYFETSNAKNGRLCKKNSIKYYKLTGDSIQTTYDHKIYVDSAHCNGIIKYIGIPPDKSTEYLGLILEEDNGDTDGTYPSNGAQYFQCAQNYGVYIPLPSQSNTQQNGQKAATVNDQETDVKSYENAEMKTDNDGNKTYTTGTAKNKVVTTVFAVNSGIESSQSGSVKDRMSLWDKRENRDKTSQGKEEKERQLRAQKKLEERARAMKQQQQKAAQIKKDKEERERTRKEEDVKRRVDEMKQKEAEQAEAERVQKERADKEREEREAEQAANIKRESEEQLVREQQESAKKAETEKAAQAQREREQKLAREKQEKWERERLEMERREAKERQEAKSKQIEREKAAEKAIKEKEKVDRQKQAKLERIRREKEAVDRAKKEKDERAKARQESIAKRDRERREKEATERQEKLERERFAKEEKVRKQRERAVEKEKLRKENAAKEKAERAEREKEENARKQREAKEKIKKQKEAFERKGREKKEKEKQAKLDKEARLKASKERADKMRKEKDEKQRKEREQKAKVEKERKQKAKDEKAKADQESKVNAEKERKEKEKEMAEKAVVSSGVDSGSIYDNDEDEDDMKDAAEMRRKQEEEEEAELRRRIMAKKKRKAEEEKKKAATAASKANNGNTKVKKGDNDELKDMMAQMNAWKGKPKSTGTAQFKRKKPVDSGLGGQKGRKFSSAPKAKKNYNKKDLQLELERSRGMDINKVTMVKLDGYEGDIPLILHLLGSELYKLNKFGTYKLFEPEEMQKKQGSDAVCNLAWNIYAFLSQLPTPLLHTVPSDVLMKAISKDVMKEVIQAMDEPFASTLVYIWDILARVAMESNESRMGQQQLGKVFGPMVTMVTQADVKGNRVSMNVLAASRMMAMFRRGIEWRMEMMGFDFEDSDDDSD